MLEILHNVLSKEVRNFNINELEELLLNAPFTETEHLIRFCRDMGLHPFDFIDKYSLERKGLIIEGKPIYFGFLTKNSENKIELWTVVNSNVKEQFTLYKEAKKTIYEWLRKYKSIFATMGKTNEKNMQWTRKIGFSHEKENDNYITYVLKEV